MEDARLLNHWFAQWFLDTLLRTFLDFVLLFLRRQFEKCRKIPKEIVMTVIISK